MAKIENFIMRISSTAFIRFGGINRSLYWQGHPAVLTTQLEASLVSGTTSSSRKTEMTSVGNSAANLSKEDDAASTPVDESGTLGASKNADASSMQQRAGGRCPSNADEADDASVLRDASCPSGNADSASIPIIEEGSNLSVQTHAANLQVDHQCTEVDTPSTQVDYPCMHSEIASLEVGRASKESHAGNKEGDPAIISAIDASHQGDRTKSVLSEPGRKNNEVVREDHTASVSTESEHTEKETDSVSMEDSGSRKKTNTDSQAHSKARSSETSRPGVHSSKVKPKTGTSGDKRSSEDKHVPSTSHQYALSWHEAKEMFLKMTRDQKQKLFPKAFEPLSSIPTFLEDFSGKTEVANKELLSKISVWRGDITRLEVDAIVNAANKHLRGGGGVDGAIHSAAGMHLLEECMTLNGCKIGEAKITGGYKLPAKYVIHTVGPMDCKKEALVGCYRASLQLVLDHKLTSVAFPCIATGIYGYPRDEAAQVALDTTLKWLLSNDNYKNVDRIIFCVFLADDYNLYKSSIPLVFCDTSLSL